MKDKDAKISAMEKRGEELKDMIQETTGVSEKFNICRPDMYASVSHELKQSAFRLTKRYKTLIESKSVLGEGE